MTYRLPLDRLAERRLMFATDCRTLDELNKYFHCEDGQGAVRARAGKFKGRLVIPFSWLCMVREDAQLQINPLWVLAAKDPVLMTVDGSGEFIDSEELIERKRLAARNETGRIFFLRKHGLI